MITKSKRSENEMIPMKEFYRLYNRNSRDNKNAKKGPIDAKLFLRDLSLPIAYIFAKLKIQANTITVAFLLISLIGNAIFISHGISSIIAFIFLLELAQLLDCVDGQLARYFGVSSKFGENFDALAHVLISGTFMLAFTARVYFETNNYIYLFIGAFAAFSKAFDYQLMQHQATFLENTFIMKNKHINKLTRYFVYSIASVIDEIRLFAIAFLILILIGNALQIKNVSQLVFIGYSSYVIFENFLYSTYLSIKQLGTVEKKTWKGWK